MTTEPGPTQRKDQNLNIRMTPYQKQLFTECAGRERMRLGTWMRRLAARRALELEQHLNTAGPHFSRISRVGVLALVLLGAAGCKRAQAPTEPLGPCNLANGLRAPLILKDGTCPGFDPSDSTGKKP